MLQRAAQARAFLDGRDFCLPDDFKQLAVAVFSHRVVASARHASLQKKSETTENVLARNRRIRSRPAMTVRCLRMAQQFLRPQTQDVMHPERSEGSRRNVHPVHVFGSDR